MGDKIAIDVWVIWTMENGRPRFYGAVESEAKAKENVDIINDLLPEKYHYAPVMLVGFGFHNETGRVYSNTDPSPQTSSSVQ